MRSQSLLLRFRFMMLTMISLTMISTGSATGLGVTQPDQFKIANGFQIELIYEVPNENPSSAAATKKAGNKKKKGKNKADENASTDAPVEIDRGRNQGSWVSLTVDPQGRLIACDQYGGLFRIDVSGKQAKVEPLDIKFEGAQGLLCAFGSLYASVNSRDYPSGIWRLTDTNGDDQYDKKEHIIPLNGGSEHGPHALILTPDGKRILTCAGNNTTLPDDKITRSRVPRNWDEDHLLGRMPDARGHNATRLAPGGFILSFNPDASDVELVATGFRNEYDIALNRDGELFAYDADMEWDVGTPWYRPTRVNHVISGAEFGWRNGTGKWPAYYPDSFGAAVNIGPGSPTGICFGYGSKFPAKFQNSLFICDWSYGNIHAVELAADGASYTGNYETFVTAAPMPVTDIVIHPTDGAMYFTIGGRQTQSGLYRVTYTGDESTTESVPTTDGKSAGLRNLRHQLESLHVGDVSADKIPMMIQHLSHPDRAIRFAARIALEHRPVDLWREKITAVENPQARILGVIALARCGDAKDRVGALAGLAPLSWSSLSNQDRIGLLRAYGLIGIRLGKIEGAVAEQVLSQIGDSFPSGNDEVDRELAQMLVYLGSDDATAKIVKEMKSSPSQENQIHYAMTLREAPGGWTEDLHRDYFQWFTDIQSARGGMSFGGFIENIKQAAIKRVPPEVQQKLAAIISPPKADHHNESAPRPLVKQWTVDELVDKVSAKVSKPNFERGKEVFGAGLCFKCHRMGLQGGILGPDLTAAGGRFGAKDLLVSIIEPSKVISDQYGATQFLTDDGRVFVGRVVNMHGTELKVMTNMLDPADQKIIPRDSIEETRPAEISMMPAGLLDTFTEAEIGDLISYLRAGGRSDHPIYQSTRELSAR